MDRFPGDDHPHFAIHHCTPVPYAGTPGDIPVPLVLPEIDREAACQPVTPGMPPVRHGVLPSPDVLRLIVPQIADAPVITRPRITGERIAFPVAKPIPFDPLSPPPDVPTAAPSGPATGAASLPVDRAAPEPTFTRPALLERFDPVFGYLIYLALGLGTFFLDVGGRYVVLWTFLIVMGGVLTLLDRVERPERISTARLIWGLGIGVLVGLPLLVLAGPGLASTAGILFPGIGPVALFQLLALTGPLGETLFFRGVLQDRRGFAASVLAVGLASLLFYWPAASATPVYLGVAAIFSTALAAVYSYVKMRYGLFAAFACQMTGNMMLVFLPGLLLG